MNLGPGMIVLQLARLLAQDPDPAPPPVEPAEPAAPIEPAAPAEPAEPTEPAVSSAAPSPEAPRLPDGFAISTRLSPEPSNIGDLLTYEVTVAYPAGHAINVPRGLSLPPLEVVGVTASEPESTGKGMRKIIEVQLQAFEVGELRVPAFELTRVGPEGEVQTLTVPAHGFEVASLLANEADPQLRPDDPPVSPDYPNTLAEAVIYGTLVGLAVAGLAAWGIVALRRRDTPEVAPPPVPPHVEALEALGRLEGERDDLIEQGEYQTYYLRLTDIAKAYLERRFGVDANDRTTEEIRRELTVRGHRIAPLSPDEVLRFLQSCDLVKFARFAPPVEEARDALYEVRRMVERTRPVVRTAAPDGKETEGGGSGGPDDGPGGPGGGRPGAVDIPEKVPGKEVA